ncbi:hypothetical protein EP7_000397 [Isosphaeraceae bacterium EP7]
MVFLNHKKAWIWPSVLLLGLILWTALAAGLDNGHLGVFHDDGLYLTAARSLRDGLGFGLPSRPGEPPPKYPIGLPAVIAVALRLDPAPSTLAREIVIARTLVLAGAWVFFLGSYTWLRRVGVHPAMACGIVLASAYHHVVLIGGAITIFADLPFAGVAFVLMARWAGRDKSPATGASRRAFADGLIAGFGILLRSNGITLALAALVAALVGPKKRPSLAACLAGLALSVVPATYYAGLHPRVVPSNSYLLEMKAGWSSPGAGLKIIASNAAAMTLDFPARVLASPTTFITPIIGAMSAHPRLATTFRVALSAIVAIGLISLARSSRLVDRPAWIHATGTMAIFLVWPWGGILDRFLLALIPPLILAFVRGLATIARHLGLAPRYARVLAAAGLVAVLAGNATVVLRSAALFHASGRQWPGSSNRVSLGHALELIRRKTEPDAVIAGVWPEMIHLHTGRTVIPLIEDESFLDDHYGDLRRFNLWRNLVPNRPLYLLLRAENEDPKRADLAQSAALAAQPGVSLREVERTTDGRYRLVKIDVLGGTE